MQIALHKVAGFNGMCKIFVNINLNPTVRLGIGNIFCKSAA